MKKNDLFGMLMSAAVGVITGLIYFCGKSTGEIEAYSKITSIIQESIDTIKETENGES